MNTNSCCTPGRKRFGCNDDTSVRPFTRKAAGSTGNMARLEGGTFLMGTRDEIGYPDDGEGPVREITLDPFYIDVCTVSSEVFARFVDDTDYKSRYLLLLPIEYQYFIVFLRSDVTRRYTKRL